MAVEQFPQAVPIHMHGRLSSKPRWSSYRLQELVSRVSRRGEKGIHTEVATIGQHVLNLTRHGDRALPAGRVALGLHCVHIVSSWHSDLWMEGDLHNAGTLPTTLLTVPVRVPTTPRLPTPDSVLVTLPGSRLAVLAVPTTLPTVETSPPPVTCVPVVPATVPRTPAIC